MDRTEYFKNAEYVSSEFSQERGVRQGCPLSPLLFIIGVEIFVKSISQSNEIKGGDACRVETAKINL